jgi:hypothetical protein
VTGPMRLALASLAAAGALAASGAAAPGFDLQSWSDFDHAWGSAGGTLYATSDAGRSWHPVFSGGTQIFRVERTSATAGIVVTGNPQPVTFWTRDAGRHWFRGTEAFATAVGHGEQLFTSNGSALEQLKPWPPRGTVRCRGAWWGSAFGPGANAKAPKNICSVPAAVATHKTGVLTLSHGALAADTLEAVPGGVAAVTTDDSARGRPLAVALFRLGRGTETPLPNSFPPETAFSGLRLLVSWPTLLVQADAGSTHVVWGSDDGGVSWATLPH